MIKIGILPSMQVDKENNPYNDIHLFSNIIINRIYDAMAMPVGILLNDGKLEEETLKMCDAFIIGGGKKIEPYFLEVINYAIKNNKPLLGICLGMQAIGLYSYLESLNPKNLSYESLLSSYKTIKQNNEQFLIPVDNHYNDKNKHRIKVKNNSKLYSIYQTKEMDVVSMHRYAVNKIGKNVLINSTCGNIIEGLEYKDENLFILGIQWHPELEGEHNILFETLVKEAKKRIKM